MSHTMIVYFLSVAVMWIPGAFAIRRMVRGRVLEQVLGGLMVAVVWPLALPALSYTTLRTRTEA